MDHLFSTLTIQLYKQKVRIELGQGRMGAEVLALKSLGEYIQKVESKMVREGWSVARSLRGHKEEENRDRNNMGNK